MRGRPDLREKWKCVMIVVGPASWLCAGLSVMIFFLGAVNVTSIKLDLICGGSIRPV